MPAADAIRWFAAVAIAVALAGLSYVLAGPLAPVSTPIVIVDAPAAAPPAAPSDLPRKAAPEEARATLLFAGDVMQHRAQSTDFRRSYAALAPLLQGYDLAVANLEFPVDRSKPLGPPPNGARFNGSPEHLAALAEAGFDLLGLANNHAFDQGVDGLAATRREIVAAGMVAVGSADTLAEVEPLLRPLNGIRIGLQAFTIQANGHPVDQDSGDWPPPDLPILQMNFRDWRGPFREEGLRQIRRQAALGRDRGAEFMVALVHWGEEWHLQPNADQRRAARDLLAAGFDLVVGAHPHVVGPPELIEGRLVAYSLGNLISDFRPLAPRTGALLGVTLARAEGKVSLVDFRYHPVLVEPDGHVVRPLGGADCGEAGEAWALARRILGPAAKPATTAAVVCG